jgi:hypothetical protein
MQGGTHDVIIYDGVGLPHQIGSTSKPTPTIARRHQSLALLLGADVQLVSCLIYYLGLAKGLCVAEVTITTPFHPKWRLHNPRHTVHAV